MTVQRSYSGEYPHTPGSIVGEKASLGSTQAWAQFSQIRYTTNALGTPLGKRLDPRSLATPLADNFCQWNGGTS